MTADAFDVGTALETAVLPVLFGDSRETGTPTLVLLSGVPGSGSSRATGRVLAQLETGAPAIRIDDLRAFYPRSADTSDEYEAAVAAVSTEWLRGAIRFARESKLSFVLDGPLRTPAVTTATAELFGEQGFDVRAVVVGARRGDAMLAVVSEYLRRVRSGDKGIAPSVSAIDAAIAGQRAVLDSLASGAPSVRIEVWEQGGRVIHDSANPELSSAAASEALAGVESSRRTTVEAVQWLSELRHTSTFAESLANRDATLATALIELHEIAIHEVIPGLKVDAASSRGAEVLSVQEAAVAARLSTLRRTLRPQRPGADLAAPVVSTPAPSSSGPSR